MADFDRYLAACEDRDADRRLRDEDDPEMAADGDEYRSRIDQLADAADRAHDEAKDREMEDRS